MNAVNANVRCLRAQVCIISPKYNRRKAAGRLSDASAGSRPFNGTQPGSILGTGFGAMGACAGYRIRQLPV